MPPKGWRKYPDGFKPVNSTGTPVKDRERYSIEDLLLPKSVVARLAKSALPNEMNLPKDGLTAVSRSATVFINYLASEANAIANVASRKTITAADVFRALENIELGGFVPSVKDELSSKCGRWCDPPNATN